PRDIFRWLCVFLPMVTLAILFGVPMAQAQVAAMISGTVTDQTGARVQQAVITVKDVETGAVRTATSGSAGEYTVYSLPIGAYEMRVNKQGFVEEVRTGVLLVVGQNAKLDFTLQVSGVSQRVNVTADAPMVSTTTADISGVVGEQQVKELPLNGRSYDLLLP